MTFLPPKSQKKHSHVLIIYAIYAVLTIVMTWPVATQLGTHIPGKIGDAYEHLWLFEWLKQGLLRGQNPIFTDLIFYPVGVSLWNHNIAWVNFIIWLPLQALMGAEAGYSIAFLLIFPLNGIATYMFLQEIDIPETAAFIGGLVAAFWPYNLSHHGHPNLILIAWAPLTMLFMHRTQQYRRWQDAAVTGVFIALIALTRWQLLIMTAPLIGFYLLFLNFFARSHIWQLLRLYFLASGVAILLIAPFFVPVLTYQLTRSNPEELLLDEEPYPTDLVAYVTPGRYHPIWGDAIRPFTRSFVGNNIYVRFVGYTALLLVMVGAIVQFRRAWFWLLMLGIYLLFALGPNLYIVGSPTIPLPYKLVEDWFILRYLRFPDRFNVLLSLPFALLVAFGSEVLLMRRPFRYKSHLFVALISFLLLFEYANRTETLPLATSAWYTTLAQQEEPFAILDIPAFSEEHFNKQYMRYQLVHGKPTVNGRVSRPPSEAFTYIRQVPLLQNLLVDKKPPTDILNLSHQMALLAAENVHYLVLHRQYLSHATQQAWLDWLVRRPIYQDEDVFVFSTEPFDIGQEISIALSVNDESSDSEFGLILVNYPIAVEQSGWLFIKALWGSAQPIRTDLSACLALVHQINSDTQESCYPVSQTWPTSLWQRNELVHASYPVQIDPFADPGEYRILLRLFEGEKQVTQQPISLGTVSITPLYRRFNPTSPQEYTKISWDGLLTLYGYDLEATPNQLRVTFHWYVQQRVGKSYKIFLHLLNDSGDQVVQADFIPHNWNYPTNWWEAGEYVVDTAVLPLDGVGSGTFRLQIGLYDPESGERLLVTSGGEESVSVDIVVLTEIKR